jgi:hypothetical protein
MGYTITFSNTPILWSLPAFGLALLLATWVAFYVPIWPTTSPLVATSLQRIVRIHLLEPWVTITWIVFLYRLNILGDLSQANPVLRSVIVTCPMALLLVPWFYPTGFPPEHSGHVRLTWWLRMYGICRWTITFLLWMTFAGIGLAFAVIGVVLLWINVLHMLILLSRSTETYTYQQ